VPPACRPGTAAAATLVIAITVWLALRGVARISMAGTAPGPAAPLVGPRVRAWYRGLLTPLEDVLVAARVHPDALTGAQLAVSVLAGAAFWAGWLFVGGWLTIVAGTLDVRARAERWSTRWSTAAPSSRPLSASAPSSVTAGSSWRSPWRASAPSW